MDTNMRTSSTFGISQIDAIFGELLLILQYTQTIGKYTLGDRASFRGQFLNLEATDQCPVTLNT